MVPPLQRLQARFPWIQGGPSRSSTQRPTAAAAQGRQFPRRSPSGRHLKEWQGLTTIHKTNYSSGEEMMCEAARKGENEIISVQGGEMPKGHRHSSS